MAWIGSRLRQLAHGLVAMGVSLRSHRHAMPSCGLGRPDEAGPNGATDRTAHPPERLDRLNVHLVGLHA